MSVPRKVIFLDIDGVMNSVNTRPQDPRGLIDFLDPRNVSVLNAIVEATGAVVVVSSTWRLSMPFAALRSTFAGAGCVAEILRAVRARPAGGAGDPRRLSSQPI